MKLKDNSTQEIDTALYQLEQKLKSNIRLTDVENSNASTAKINAVDKKLTEEIKDRQSADEKLQDNINKEIADRQDADAAIENAKQDKLIAGDNIQIDGNVISATSKEYTAEAPVKVTDGKISLDTVPIAKGGTGATTAKEAFMNLANGLSDDVNPIDTEHIIFKNTDGTNWGLYTLSHFWNYIKSKISSVLGLTKDNYGGKAATAGTADKVANALTVNGKTYDGSSAVNAGVQTVANGGTGVTTQDDINKAFINDLYVGNDDVTDGTEFVSSYASDNGFAETGALNKPYKRQFIKVWNYIKGKISSVLGLTVTNYGGKASTAGTADKAKNMYSQTLDLSELDKTKFYPVFCVSSKYFAEVAICSPSLGGSAEYNQNRIHFDISTYGWSDEPFTLNIREYACFDNNEITIGCIGRGVNEGGWAIWLRGGQTYSCFTRDCTLSLKTSDYAYGTETYTVGTNYYGGTNTNVSIVFTPQSTIKDGAYSSRPITAPNIKVIGKFYGDLSGKASTAGTADNASTAETASYAKKLKPFAYWQQPYVYDPTNGVRVNVYKITMLSYFNSILVQIYDDINYTGCRRYILGLWHVSNYGYNVSVTDLGGTKGNGLKVWMGTDGNVYLQADVYWISRITFSYLDNPTDVTITKIGNAKYGSNKDIDGNVLFTPLTDPITDCGALRGAPDLSSASKVAQILKTDELSAPNIKANRNITLNGASGVSLSTYGSEPLTIGYPSGTNDGKSLGFDRNSIQARTNGAASNMYLNWNGGNVQIGSSGVAGSKLIIQGATVNSNSYSDTNPKLEFKNNDESQNISLTFTDYDSVQAPASLTLNGNQGNEYFIAPNIKATTKFIGNLTGNVTGNVSGSSGSASKLTTARTAYVELGNANTNTTVDWSGTTTIPVNGVLAVENGGTGCNTAEGAANSLIASLAASDKVPVDSDYFISQVVNGGPFVPGYQRRPVSKLWEYIKGKILQEGEDFGYNHIVHDDASLLEWANCTDGSMKKVLVKSGTYNMTKGVDFSKAGTGYVFAENGAVINSKVPIAFTAPSGKTAVHNLKVVCGPSSDNTCAFSANDVLNLILYDCEAGYSNGTVTVNRNLFSKCTCYNCHYDFTYSSSNSSMSIKVFYQCYCYNCICKQTIAANSSSAVSFSDSSYFYKECVCISCDAELSTSRNIKAATPSFSCYYNCWDRCVGCLSEINVNSNALTVYSTLYGFLRCQHMSSCKETHTVGYSNIKGVVQCIYISSTSAVSGESNTSVGNSCDI